MRFVWLVCGLLICLFCCMMIPIFLVVTMTTIDVTYLIRNINSLLQLFPLYSFWLLILFSSIFLWGLAETNYGLFIACLMWYMTTVVCLCSNFLCGNVRLNGFVFFLMMNLYMEQKMENFLLADSDYIVLPSWVVSWYYCHLCHTSKD